VATTDDGCEKPIVELCEKLGYKYFRGSEKDVLGRFFHAARSFGAKEGDTIVRICSDSPFIDAATVKKLLDFYQTNDFMYATNLEGKYPRGLEAEVFSFELLGDAHQNARDEYQREHVTTYIREKYEVGYFDENRQDYSKHKLTLDTQDDYILLQKVFERLGCNTHFGYTELLGVLDGVG